MDNNYMEVVQHVNEYFKKHLSKYTVLEVRRQSYHPEDDYLYMVSAVKEDGSFAVWSFWNEGIQSLNGGHYNLSSMEDCAKLMSEYQIKTYTDENSTPMEVLQELLIQNDDSFESSYQELLYIKGFVDGITRQQEHNWGEMTDTEVRALLQKAVEE